MKKSQIRKKIFYYRKSKNLDNYNITFKSVSNILKNMRSKGKVLGGYYPFNYEVNVMNILEKFEKQNYFISLPKIKKNSEMDFFNWSTTDPMMINKYGIPEPTSNQIKYPDILLVPLVAFDKDLNRVGYGGGFYDRYIKKIKKIKKVITIGLAYSFQKVKKISVNKYDMKLDFIVTEKEN